MLEKSVHQEGLWPTYSIDNVLFDLPPQVLETVCTKKGFDPATHRLQHHRKFLDTSTTVRFSGERYGTPFLNQSLVIWATFSATYRYHRVVPNSLFAGLSATFLLCLTFNFNWGLNNKFTDSTY